jgi:hypothetical protein
LARHDEGRSRLNAISSQTEIRRIAIGVARALVWGKVAITVACAVAASTIAVDAVIESRTMHVQNAMRSETTVAAQALSTGARRGEVVVPDFGAIFVEEALLV